MTIRTLAPLVLFGAILAGCSSNPGTKSEPVAVTGTVTFGDGKPVKDVTLNIFPNTSDQLPASAPSTQRCTPPRVDRSNEQ